MGIGSDARAARADRWVVGRGRFGRTARRWLHGAARAASLLAGGVLVAGIVGGNRWPPVTSPPAAAGVRPGRGTPAPVPAPTLAAEIDALLDGEPGVYGVVVATAAGETLYGRNADAPFVAASLYKLPVMAAVLAAQQAGELRLDEAILVENAGEVTIADALRAMIEESSNEAAVALYERVGIDAVNRTAADLGLDRTRMACDPTTLPGWPPRPGPDGRRGEADRATRFVLDSAALGWVNVTTPRETAAFFGLLLRGEVVDRRASARMLQTLLRQEVDDRFPARLPKGTAVAHKTGNLPGVVHDAGVIYAPDGPVVLVALAEDVPDEARAVAVLQRLAVVVHRAHGGSPRRPALGGGPERPPATPVTIGPPPAADRRPERATPTGG